MDENNKNRIKLSDYVAEFISGLKINHVFGISGGASLHLIHSVAENKNLSFVCTHHEQAAAMAADGYSRSTGEIGVAIATSGPGATNLITGICCSYYDSVPLLLITGQVSTFRMTGKTGVRQIGFQETPITKITQDITKYSITITDPNTIKYELGKAIHIAKSGRPGPVLIDIPDNFQRVLIDKNKLKSFIPNKLSTKKTFPQTNDVLRDILKIINSSERPIAIAGWGLHISKTERDFLYFIKQLNIPVALTWGASDILEEKDSLYVGTFGTHGRRYSNFAVQNADLIISLGSRLDTKATGSPINTFARDAKKIVIDIDPHELGKFKSFDLEIDLLIQDDLRNFFSQVNPNLKDLIPNKNKNWLNKINDWKIKFSEITKPNKTTTNPYYVFKKIADFLKPNTNLYIDTGCSIAWAMQSMSFSKGQRIYHDFNNTAMGWALPAAIGGFFSNKGKEIVCIAGDGSFMMSMQELATVYHHKIPIKLIVINNSGYSMIQQTQDQWLASKYIASSNQGGLSFPNYSCIAKAYNMEYYVLDKNKNINETLSSFINSSGSSFLNIKIPSDARVSPQVKFGRPNEDMEPLLPRKLFMENMIVEPLSVSYND